MTAPELHADDLLDKEARGDLSPAEKSRLDRHVEACSVCRFERQVRDDFRLEFETLGQAARSEAKPGATRRAGDRRRPVGRVSSRMRLVLLAAAATLVAGAAAAEWATIKQTVFSSVVMNAHTEAPLLATSSAAKTEDAISRPADEPTVDPVVAPAPAPDDAPKATTIQRQASSSPATARHDEPAVEPSVQAAVTADTLFAAANDERQHGAYGEAIRVYRDLSQQFPQSAEATASHAIVGRLLLDRGDPSGALVQFDEYLQSGMTTLGEEARVGRALSLQRLGRSAEEAEGWTTLLSTYPQSVHASRARSRLAALGNR
jgi:TolA-binding protein